MTADREFKADIFQKTAAQWTAENPSLAQNDVGVESDTGKWKIGVGLKWADTPYLPGDPASSVAWANITDKPTFATVATSGAYADLSDKPSLAFVPTASAPASATATGTAGQFAYDASYIYICTATDTWRRIAHDTWT